MFSRFFLCTLLALAVASGGARAKSLKADPEPFCLKLESIGMDATYLRALLAKVPITFALDEDDHAAVFGTLLGRLELRWTLRDGETNKLRYNVDFNELNTLAHESCHADWYYNLHADWNVLHERAQVGSPAHAHWEAHNYYWVEQSKKGILLQANRLKAEEVCGYIMGASVEELFRVVDELAQYNRLPFYIKEVVKTKEDLERLKDQLVLPDPATSMVKGETRTRLAPGFRFGQVHPSEVVLGSSPVTYTDNPYTRSLVYDKVLGLNTPKTTGDLVARLNSIDTPFARELRADVLSRRQAAMAETLASRGGNGGTAAPTARVARKGKGKTKLMGVKEQR